MHLNLGLPGGQVGEQLRVALGGFDADDAGDFLARAVGSGTGTALPEGNQPLPRVQTKTVISVMLGGTQMEEMDFGD